MEENVRKLCLTLAAGLVALSTGALPSRADGIPPGAMTNYQTAFDETDRPSIELVHWSGRGRQVCTHFWNGRWHFRQRCFWAPGHGYHYRHHRY
jgi:hypothetical protein